MSNSYNAAVAAISPMPDRIRRRPISAKGYPIPWFVAWIDGAPDFRVIGPGRLNEARAKRRCWICGEPLGVYLASVIGPMCAINRTISEPPSHRECAIFAARACPFLANPRMRRNEFDLPEQRIDAPGVPIERNPGAVAVWISLTVKPFRLGRGILFRIGEPTEVQWFAEGRLAMRSQVVAAIEAGMPILLAVAEREGAQSVADLHKLAAAVEPWLPKQ